MIGRLLLTRILLTLSFVASASATESDQRVPIRLNIQNCESFLIPGGKVKDDSVGTAFSTNRPEDFRAALIKLIDEGQTAELKGARFYVVGVAMSKERETRRAYKQLLEETGAARFGARVTILSVPTYLVQREAVGLARQIWERTRYYFPSLTRDLQQPQIGELTSGFISSYMVEVPNLILLYHRLPPRDALLSITSQMVLLSSMLIYEKSLINWFLRGAAQTSAARRIEIFTKNVLVSFPFVLSYHLFGNFSSLLEYLENHSSLEALARFPGVVADFSVTQGLTMFLQALFYSQVITSGTSAWVNRQIGESNSRTARTLRPWLEFPVLVVNAALLAWASSGQADVLATFGPLEVNAGHAALAGMTTVGASVFWASPNLLDPTLTWFRNAKAFIIRLTQINIES